MGTVCLSLLVAGGVSGCNHNDDLDRLKDAKGAAGTPSPGGNGDGDGEGGGGGDSGGGGGTGGGEPPPDFCQPCPDPPAGAVEWESCCTGPARRFCGFSVVGGNGECLRIEVPGEDDPGCPSAEICDDDGCSEGAGCCRPDGHCGVVIPGIDGCIDRVAVPVEVGGPFTPRPCTFPCADDSSCGGTGNGFICTEADQRVCARECFSDLDCVREEVCALRNNAIEDRVESVCQEPLGPGGVGEDCSTAFDCASGTCSGPPDGQNHCSRLCAGNDECGGALDTCGDATIPTPSTMGTQTFRICK